MDNAPDRALSRREFMTMSLLLGASAAGIASCGPRPGKPSPQATASQVLSPERDPWDEVRRQFDLDPEYLHFASFVLASHPGPVREAIERHRRGLDRNTELYLNENGPRLGEETLAAASTYLKADPQEIALTDSTTMGLGLLYGGLRLREGQEILTTEHDFYSTHEALRLRAERTGASIRRIALYQNIRSVSVDEIVQTIRGALAPQTRVVALTWVHSSTGLKLPIRPIAEMLAESNAIREEQDRVLLCVDGVHGLGVEDARMEELGCDFFVAGCHKWLFGPRGTGLIWGKRGAWPAVMPIIPTFELQSILAWISGREPAGLAPGAAMTPGGYHSFEHRWALAEAFRFHQQIGKDRIAERTHLLSRQLKEGLATMPHVTLYTPMETDLSAGIVCFEVAGLASEEVVARLQSEHRLIASVTPYVTRYVRLGPSLVNSTAEVEQALEAIRAFGR